MKIIVRLLATLVLTPLLNGIKMLFLWMSTVLAGRWALKRQQKDSLLPGVQTPETGEEALEYLLRPVSADAIDYFRRKWLYHFLIAAGFIDGGLFLFFVMLQISGVWIPIAIFMALLTFTEAMAYRAALKEARKYADTEGLKKLSGQELITLANQFSGVYEEYLDALRRARGRQWRVLSLSLLIAAALLIGLQADYLFRARETSPGVWQLRGFQYRLTEDGSAEVAGYNGIWKKIRVPSSFRGAPVTSVGAKAFSTPDGDYRSFGRKDLKEILLPDTLTFIGESAFYGCTELKQITVPEGVTEIGDKAFYYCYGLVSASLPKGLLSIGNEAFGSCSSLRSLMLPESLVRIGDMAFRSCSSLTEIFIPAGVTDLGGNPFQSCSCLKAVTVAADNPAFSVLNGALCDVRDGTLIWIPSDSVTAEYRVPEGIRRIGDSVFSYCSSLERVILPEGLESIGSSAFNYCGALTEAALPEGLLSIGDYAFSGCKSLSGVVLPSSLTVLGTGAFYNCKSLTEITIPSGVAEIPSSAFSGCTGLTNVTLDEGVSVIGVCAFSNCKAVESVLIPRSVSKMSFYAVFADETALIVYPGSEAENICRRYGMEYTFPEGAE